MNLFYLNYFRLRIKNKLHNSTENKFQLKKKPIKIRINLLLQWLHSIMTCIFKGQSPNKLIILLKSALGERHQGQGDGLGGTLQPYTVQGQT